MLDISPLTNAIARFDEGVASYLSDTTNTLIRDGLIQRFEFTYELSHKMLKRYLESTSASPAEYDGAEFPFIIRSANEQGLLLGDWTNWKKYREMRSKTSHTYDEDVALAVVAGLAAFQQEAHHLHDQISARLQN